MRLKWSASEIILWRRLLIELSQLSENLSYILLQISYLGMQLTQVLNRNFYSSIKKFYSFHANFLCQDCIGVCSKGFQITLTKGSTRIWNSNILWVPPSLRVWIFGCNSTTEIEIMMMMISVRERYIYSHSWVWNPLPIAKHSEF
mgnify:CR=1 FL=1